jgi:hypothetical protein
LIVGAAGAVDPNQHLIGAEHLGGIDGGARDDARLAIVAGSELAARTDDFGQADETRSVMSRATGTAPCATASTASSAKVIPVWDLLPLSCSARVKVGRR